MKKRIIDISNNLAVADLNGILPVGAVVFLSEEDLKEYYSSTIENKDLIAIVERIESRENYVDMVSTISSQDYFLTM